MKSIFSLLLLSTILGACSTDSTPPVNPNPLTLSLIDGKRPGGLGLFTLNVTMRNLPLKGAALNMRVIPGTYAARIKNVSSDSTGTFKFIVPWGDTTQGVQFQALYDSLFGTVDSTLKSNVISWAP